MAKKFGGFTPEQMGKMIPEMQGMQADEQNLFLQANPGAASRVGKMTQLAHERITMSKGGYMTRGYAPGGDVVDPNITANQAALNAAQKTLAEKTLAMQQATTNLASDPANEAYQAAIATGQSAVASAEAGVQQANKMLATVGIDTATEAKVKVGTDPGSMINKSATSTVTDAEKTDGKIDKDTSESTAGDATQSTLVNATIQDDMTVPDVAASTQYTALKAEASVKAVMDRLVAATGKPSEEALVEASTMKPEDLAQLGLSVDQIAEAQKVQAPEARTVQEGEMVEGSTVDMDRVKTETNFEAVTGAPSTDATVQGQLTGLMEDFETGKPPVWAAGAMREAAAIMASRGLSSSSMAGQALIQAAMESAVPIAQADADTFAKFESDNLNRRQEAALFAAEQRAKFLGLEFDQEFETRVTNATTISRIADTNFNAEVTIALENAQMAQTVDISNLDARNAKVLADAAAMTTLDMTNLDNVNRAKVSNARAFLEMDMSNLDRQQQVATIKAQENANAILTDRTAENAALQFNATSKDQRNQFVATLTQAVGQFNISQKNAMNEFNAGEANALANFNTSQDNLRDQFNAANHLVIAQANANWIQNITTTENAADNQANRDAALAENNLTVTNYNNILQKERDLMAWAWTSAENAMERDMKLMIAKIDAAASADSSPSVLATAGGDFLARLAVNYADTFWN